MNSTTISKLLQATARISLCGERAIEIAGQVFTPDKYTAYVECYLSHSFPVVTVDNTTLHPQVVANSYRSMFNKVFDLAHLMKVYDPQNNKRDHQLGTIVAVEFPPTPEGGWTVQGDKALAPGIRALACMHKQAENVGQILNQYFTGSLQWTVSMENEFSVEASGFLVKQGRGMALAGHGPSTPEDLLQLGWVYCSWADAPQELRDCVDRDEAKIIKKYHGCETLLMPGGLDGRIQYFGIGLTPLGKEKEAEITRVLASEKLLEVEGLLVPDVVGLLKKTASFPL